MGEQTVEIGGDIGLRVRTYGPADGPPLLLLHGAAPGASGPGNWGANIDALADTGWRIILPDLPGFGQSSKPIDVVYDVAFFTSAISALLDRLGVARLAVVGNSFGGAIANQLAATQPGRVAALVSAAPHCLAAQEVYWAMPGVQFMIAALTQGEPSEARLAAVLEKMVHDPAHITPALVADRWASALAQPPQVMMQLKVEDMRARLSSIGCPVLGFWGANDQITPPAGALVLAQEIPGSEVVLMAETGHWPQLEQAARFNALALSFLGNHRARL